MSRLTVSCDRVVLVKVKNNNNNKPVKKIRNHINTDQSKSTDL